MNRDAAAMKLAALELDYQELGEEIARLKGEILAQSQPGEVLRVDGEARYRISPGRRTFDQGLAVAILNDATRLACSVTKVDPARVKTYDPNLWAACCTTGQPYVSSVTR